MDFNTEELSKYYDQIITWVIAYFPKIIWAVLVLWIWFKVVNMLQRWIEKIMDKQKLDPMLKSFLWSLLNWILKILVVISAAGMLWIQTSSFVAMLAAAWLAIGMALSWTLQNFAGWIMILFFKPFKIGHFIEVWWFAGTIKEIHIFNTIMLTADNKRIIIPNADITSSPMINFSAEQKRRVDHVVWISYDDDIDKAKEVLQKIADDEVRIIKKDWVRIWVMELWADSVNIVFRFYVKSKDYWDVYLESLEKVKKEFDKNWLNFPYPQRDVHIHNKK